MVQGELWIGGEQASKALRARGIPVSAKTLSRMALRGEVPSRMMAAKRRYRLSVLVVCFEGPDGGGEPAPAAHKRKRQAVTEASP